MLGAIIGDIAGSRFEWNDHKSKDFSLFGGDGISEAPCQCTDDSVMTVAVADALLHYDRSMDDAAFKALLVERMHHHGRARMNCGFGRRFYRWLRDGDTEPYGSYGNGSAMRVSPVAWYADTLEETEHLAALTAEVTHNHPEGIKGAQAVAAAIFLALLGKNKEDIRAYVETQYYPGAFDTPLDVLRPDFDFDVSCQGTVPPALLAFFESKDFEDAVRNAVSLGGDSDTIACITGSIAEAFYGIPGNIRDAAMGFPDKEMRQVITDFYEYDDSSASRKRKMYPPIPELCSEDLIRFFTQFPGYTPETTDDLRELADRLNALKEILLPHFNGRLGIAKNIGSLNFRAKQAGLSTWYDFPPDELNLQDLLTMLVYPFAGRMGSPWEAEFALKGWLGTCLVNYREKCRESEK